MILAVDDEPDSLALLERVLRSRDGADYQVACDTSADASSQRLRELKEDGVPLALVLADQWMPETTGVELPVVKRAVWSPGTTGRRESPSSGPRAWARSTATSRSRRGLRTSSSTGW